MSKSSIKASLLMTVFSIGLCAESAWSQGAVNNTYSISGSCSSQGNWTQNALTHTARLKEVLSQLKNNGSCTGIKSSITASLDMVKQQLDIINSQKGNGASVANLPLEISSLRTFVREKSAFQDQVIKSLIQKTLHQENMTSRNVTDEKARATAQQMESIGKRVHDATVTGLTYFNGTVSSLMEAKADCLDDVPAGNVASGLIQTLAAFAGGSQGQLSPQLSQSVNTVFQYFGREKKYIDALRRLNDRQFVSSMSCLLESTSEGYCTALDGRYLLEEIVNQHDIEKKKVINSRSGKEETVVAGTSKNFNSRMHKGPLAGYYLLTNQMRVVNDWIQKLQYGNTPQIPTEAQFQVAIIENVQMMIKSMKEIEGKFNMQFNLMKSMDRSAQQTTLKNLLMETVGMMVNGGAGNLGENFYTKIGNSSELMYRELLDMDVPLAILGKGSTHEMMFSQDPFKYLDAKYRDDIPAFQNPMDLAAKIQQNLTRTIVKARTLAENYYSRFFIVDKEQIVGESLLGMNSNVRDALSHIDLYLKDLSERIEKRGKDPTLIGPITSTRSRIGNVLVRYKRLLQFGQTVINDKSMKPHDMEKKLRTLSEDLLKEVYAQFEVMLARAGWLQNRMSTFVMYDYTMSVRDLDTFDPYVNDLMISTGYQALQQMFGMSDLSYSRALTDLSSALNIYNENLRALEGVSAEVFQRHIFRLDAESQSKPMTVGDMYIQAQKNQLATDMAHTPNDPEWMDKIGIPTHMGMIDVRTAGAAIKNLYMNLTGANAEQYGMPSALEQLNSVTDTIYVTRVGNEFQTARFEKAMLCTQTLAFMHLRPFWGACFKSTLPSPLLKETTEDQELYDLMVNYLSVPYVKKAYEHIERNKKTVTDKDRFLNMSKRICALRDYHRRNEIAKVTAALRDDNGQYESEFTKLAEVEMEALSKEAEENPTTIAPPTTPAPSTSGRPSLKEIEKTHKQGAALMTGQSKGPKVQTEEPE